MTYEPSAKLNGCTLIFVDGFIYLSHVINQRMTDDNDIQTTKLTVTGNKMLRWFSFCSREVKSELFRSHFNSVHCTSLWSRYRVVLMNSFSVPHNDILEVFWATKLDKLIQQRLPSTGWTVSMYSVDNKRTVWGVSLLGCLCYFVIFVLCFLGFFTVIVTVYVVQSSYLLLW